MPWFVILSALLTLILKVGGAKAFWLFAAGALIPFTTLKWLHQKNLIARLSRTSEAAAFLVALFLALAPIVLLLFGLLSTLKIELWKI
jgi:hypothetical protein